MARPRSTPHTIPRRLKSAAAAPGCAGPAVPAINLKSGPAISRSGCRRWLTGERCRSAGNSVPPPRSIGRAIPTAGLGPGRPTPAAGRRPYSGPVGGANHKSAPGIAARCPARPAPTRRFRGTTGWRICPDFPDKRDSQSRQRAAAVAKSREFPANRHSGYRAAPAPAIGLTPPAAARKPVFARLAAANRIPGRGEFLPKPAET